MKNRFKKLFTTLIASFALSSCANFLPQLPSSRLSSNETSKEAFSNSQNNATSNSSSFNDEISSVINRHSSDITDSDTTSSENHISSNVYASSENADISSSSQTYSSSASIDDRFPIDDDYCIHAYDGFPRGKVDNQYFTRFEMLHSVDGENVPLDASSCSATTDDEGLSIYTSVTNGSKSYLEVTLLGRTESLFTFNVNLKARNGVTLTREYKLPVTYDMESTDIFVSYDSYRYLSYAYGDTIIFEECHKNTNNHTLTFDSDRPYDIGYYDESKIEITGFSLEDNDTRLGVKIKPLVCYCEGYIDLKLIFSNGDTQNVKQFYYVDPPYNFEPQDGVVIAYDQTEEFTFSFRDFKDARHQAEFDATDVHYFCSGGITCELVNITNTSLTFSISNTARSDYSYLYLEIMTSDAHYFMSFSFSIVSYESYYGTFWGQCDIIGRVCYQQECTLRFYFINRAGDYIRLKDITITSKYGYFQNATFFNINANYCLYTVTPNNYGYDELDIVATDYDGVEHSMEVGFDIPQM